HTVDQIGLNVRADNQSAIAAYERLGFTRFAAYEEYDLRAAS
ncbi:MAG TPA: GNAT family N-acetyltransferase, partial [Roseiflexaceae bacterium]|nr:GNAT family N-acetyltransferase [Roseiflexaceae bacterium]